MLIVSDSADAPVLTLEPASLFSRLVGVARIAREYPALRRWYMANRWRQLTLPGECAVRQNGYSAPPRSLSFRPTFLCNASCRMCSYANSVDPECRQPITHRQEIMDLGVACRLADAVAPSHTMINITGGEPLIWGERLFDFLDYCRQRGVATSVTTNGSLLARHLDRLLASPPDVLVFSLHGPRDTHNAIVGMQAFDGIASALAEILQRKGGDRYAPPLLVTNTAMLPDNATTFPDVVDISARLGAVAANFQPVWIATDEMHREYEAVNETYDRRFTAGHRAAPQRVHADTVWQGMQRVRARARELGLPVNFYPRLRKQEVETYYHHPEQPLGRTRALCAHLFTQINPDGAVIPCLGHEVGNLYADDFLSIWNGPAMRDFRARLDRARLFPICSRCCFLWRTN